MPRTFTASRSLFIAIASIALSVSTVCLALGAGARSTKDGVFSAAQVERGKTVYEAACKNCHQADFYSERLQRWQNKSVDELFQAVSTAMPADNVGSLATSEYVDVLAYIFSITGSPVGSSELTADNMGAVKIAAPK
jgi:mono/diheme cytochrome c family protein